MPDDATLLQLYIRQRSEEAFAQLVHRHVDLVYGIALRQLRGEPRDPMQLQVVTAGHPPDAPMKRKFILRRNSCPLGVIRHHVPRRG